MRAARICTVLLALFLVAAISPAAAQQLGTDAQRAEGKALYDKYCSQCHGLAGDGYGYATHRVRPQPRDFTAGKYKFRTTPSGALPTDADLVKVIRDGLPYSSMPAWSTVLSGNEIQQIAYYLKTFSEDFQNPDRYSEPIAIPEPPPVTDDSIARGAEVYQAQGCGACHGELGRGNGTSSPTLTDDWGFSLRPVDMTKRWTFRGGPTRKDIFRTFSTGVNGTPMPSFADSLSVDERWQLVDFIVSLGAGDDPGYAELVEAVFTEDELDTTLGEELFAAAPRARFPLLGQITQPGRNFYPALESIEVRAVYNRREIAFLLNWHDMRAETSGSNNPALAVPTWDEDNPTDTTTGDAEGEGDFWGDEAEAEDEGDFWGDETVDEAAGGEAFSDAVALQFPSRLPTGNRKPYFIFGDAQSAVDLWFVDLARARVEQFVGRGSSSLEPSESDEIAVTANYDNGRWSVVFKRDLKAVQGVTFEEGIFAPIAFSVWDGASRDRGNRRALSRWFSVYMRPSERVSPWGPMLRAASFVLFVELLGIFWIRRRHASRATL